MGRLNASSRRFSFPVALFLILVILDVGAVFVPSLGVLGVAMWFASYGVFIGFAVGCAIDLIRHLTVLRSLFTCIVISLLLGQIALNVNDPKNLSGETADEIGCALAQLQERPDSGFRGDCEFGYPTRQYFLPALPTLIFGRTLAALNLGGSLYFMLGVFIFSSGSLNYLGYDKAGDLATAFLLGSIPHFLYVNHFLFFFEQSIFPFSLGLIGAGLLLHILAKGRGALSLVGIWLLYLIYSYTPSLALYFLALTVLTYLVFVRVFKEDRGLVIAFVALSLVSFALSLTMRHDINILFPEERSYSQLGKDMTEGVRLLVFQEGGANIISPFFQPVALLTVMSALLFVFGWEFAALAVWIVLVGVIAIAARGYTYYGVQFRLHRTMVAIPVLLSLMAGIARRLPMKRFTLVLPAAFLVVSGLHFQDGYLSQRKDQGELEMIHWISRYQMQTEVDRLYYLDQEGRYFGNLGLFLHYFHPKLRFVDGRGEIMTSACTLHKEVYGLLFTPTTDSCIATLRESEAVRPVVTMPSRLRGEIAVFEVQSQGKSPSK